VIRAVNDPRLRGLLQRCGVRLVELDPEGDGEVGADLAGLDLLGDPVATERLGASLAGRAGAFDPTIVVVWEDVLDLLLGFVVGLQLAVPVIRAYDSEGLAVCERPLPEGGRAVLVGDAFEDRSVIDAVEALLKRYQGSLVGVVAIVPPPWRAQGPAVSALLSAAASESEGAPEEES
jgi:hypothetical protein